MKGKNDVVANTLSRIPPTLSLMDILVDWKAHLLVEYSKNKFSCEIIDGQVQDDRYQVSMTLSTIKTRFTWCQSPS